MSSHTYLALDVGEKRIGVARGDDAVRIAAALETIEVDGTEIARIEKLYKLEKADCLIVGYPRNQSGEPTKQTDYVERFVEPLRERGYPVVFQDESLTSVMAEDYLKQAGKPYQKGDIDALAAALILQDYLEQQ